MTTEQESAKDFWRNTQDYNYGAAFPERHKNMIAFAQKWLLPRMKPGDCALDIGCADGWFSFLVSRRLKEIDAVDLSEKLLTRARDIAKQVNVTNINFQLGDITTFTPAKSYNHIFCMGLLMYIFENAAMVDILSRLRPHIANDGTLVLKDTLSQENTKMYKTPNYQACYRSRDDYIKLVESAGYRLLGEDLISPQGVDNSISKSFLFEKA